jgi:hypothetical protein
MPGPISREKINKTCFGKKCLRQVAVLSIGRSLVFDQEKLKKLKQEKKFISFKNMSHIQLHPENSMAFLTQFVYYDQINSKTRL